MKNQIDVRNRQILLLMKLGKLSYATAAQFYYCLRNSK